MSLPNYFITALAQTLNVGGNDTTIQLSTIMTIDGQTITTSDFAQYGRGILTINPLSLASVEFASFTGINPALGANGGVTGALRGLSSKGNNQIAGNQKFNPIGTPVLISFGTHNLLDIPALAGTNAFTGANSFSVSPTAPTGGTGNMVATATDIANALSGTSGTATNLVYGTVKLSVAASSAPAPIVVGTNDPRVPPSPGTSGGIVGYTSTTAVASSVLLTQHALVIGGGAGATPTPLASLGTSTTVLHGAAAGDPTWGAVSLTADVSGVLPVANGGTGSATANGYFTLVQTITFTTVSALTATVTTLADFTGLAGDTDDIYILNWEITTAAVASSTRGLGIRYNADTGNNYIGNQGLLGATYSGNNTTVQSYSPIVATIATAGSFGSMMIFAKNVGNNRGATFSAQTVNNAQELGQATWVNSANQITEATITIIQASGSTQTYSGKASLYKIVR